MTMEILRLFAGKDTRDQLSILRRVGLETECADRCLAYLAGMFPHKYSALMLAISRHEKGCAA